MPIWLTLSVTFHVRSIKAHSLGTRGYKGNYLAYFSELAGLARTLSTSFGWSMFYYRPGPATHFATAEAGYVPSAEREKREKPKQCTPLSKNASAQKQLFVHEEGVFVQTYHEKQVVMSLSCGVNECHKKCCETSCTPMHMHAHAYIRQERLAALVGCIAV